MSLLAAERIKLFTTRSPWWCMAIAVVATAGFAALFAGLSEGAPITVSSTQIGWAFGMVVVMVMAVLAVTTEYRFGTIRATFQAVPRRTSALLAKNVVMAVLAGVLGEVTAFASWAAAKLVKPSADLGITTPYEWRAVAGVGVVYALAALIAIAVGTMIRHSAGAITVVLVYTLLAEDLIALIPNVGLKIHRWLPFTMAQHFLTGAPDPGPRAQATEITYSPWFAGAYFAAFAVVVLALGLFFANRRDA